MEEVGTKKALNRNKVLELLNEGKTVDEIAKMYNRTHNAVQAHVRRLRMDGKYKSKEVVQGELDYDRLLDTFLKRIEKSMDSEQKIAQLESENIRLRNQLAATQNELLVVKDELKGKPETQERLRNIQKRLNLEQIRLSQEAQR